MKTNLLNSLLLAAVLCNAGCVAVVLVGGAAGGTYAYVSGELKGNEQASLDRVWKSTLVTMTNLQFTITELKRDTLEGHVTAKDAEGKTIQIKFDTLSMNLVEVRIRVGVFGDSKLSGMIMDKIHENLPPP